MLATLRFVLLGLLVGLPACAREARLYPNNEKANGGLLNIKFVDSGMGRGPIEVTLPSGELMKGECSTTDTSAYGFGSAISVSGSRSAIATGSTVSTPGHMPGVASLVGDAGTTMHCEYTVNSLTGSGSGVCQTNKGAVYRLHF
jgi:hypothetical protein